MFNVVIRAILLLCCNTSDIIIVDVITIAAAVTIITIAAVASVAAAVTIITIAAVASVVSDNVSSDNSYPSEYCEQLIQYKLLLFLIVVIIIICRIGNKRIITLSLFLHTYFS